MTISRGQLKGTIWRYLGKTAAQPGFYTSDKMDDAIEEALAYIAVEMFVAGDGWLTKYVFIDTVAGQTSIDIPGDVALIREVRYKYGDTYSPMYYTDLEKQPSYIGTGVTQSIGTTYRLLGSQLVFDPPLGSGGDRFLQIEYVYYPKKIVSDSEMINSQYDTVCMQFMKYKAASILAGSLEKQIITWQLLELQWEDKLKTILNRRVMSSQPIREFL